MRCSATTVLPVPGPPSTTSAPAGSGTDDGVLVGLDGAEHVAHPGRPAAAQGGDERGLVVQRGVALQAVGGEHLVPVVADPAAGPAVPAAAGQPHRVGVGRAEERLGGGRAPVEQQPATRAVGEAEPADVDGFGVLGADDAAEAQVQPVAAQGAQASGEPVDLLVPVHRRLPRCRRAPGVRRRGGRTARRSTARGSPRWPRSAARRRRSAPGRPSGKGAREGRTHWWSVNARALQVASPGSSQRFCATTRVLPQAPGHGIR